jgi:uncharacterized Zn-binding protein involved in type VI secretion
MPGIVRVGDTVTTHHVCTTSTTIIKAAARTDTVFINGIAVALVGDKTPIHSYTSSGKGSCNVSHSVSFTTGSSTVFAYGTALLRIGDKDTGNTEELTGGSGSVFAD